MTIASYYSVTYGISLSQTDSDSQGLIPKRRVQKRPLPQRWWPRHYNKYQRPGSSRNVQSSGDGNILPDSESEGEDKGRPGRRLRRLFVLDRSIPDHWVLFQPVRA